MMHARRIISGKRGFTLIEAMVLLVILSIVSVAAGIGLQSVIKAPTAADQIMAIDNFEVDTLEQWKVKTWAAMNPSSPYATPYSVSDTVTINGKNYTRMVVVSDADPASPESGGTPQPDFRRITVVINSQRMRTYVAKPN